MGASWATRRWVPSKSSGGAVRRVQVGDRVLVSCITSCGTCRFCREARYGQCLGGGGWILGHTIDGTQAERVRVPFADTSTYAVPRRRARRGRPHAGRHHPDRLRGRRAQRAGPARRRGGHRRCRPHRAQRHHGGPAVQPEPHHRHRPRRLPARRGQALRRRCRRQQRPRGPARRRAVAHRRARRRCGHRSGRPRRQPSSWPPASCDRAVTSPTSACTAPPPPCTSKACGAAT